MDLAEIDRTLARFRQAAERMTSNLVDLETDTIRTRLDQAALTGLSATRWSEAGEALGHLWQWFTEFNGLLERAGELRGGKSRLDPDRHAQLQALLAGPSIQLATADIPAAQRGLLGAAESTQRCTPEDLLARMVAAYDQVGATIAAAGHGWAVLEPRAQASQARLAAADQLAVSLGEQHRPELGRLRGQLSALAGTVASDPLSVDPATVDQLDASIAAADHDLHQLAALRDRIGERFNEARGLLAELAQTIDAGAEAHLETMAKIASPQVPAPLHADPGLERGLDQAAAASARAEWRAAQRLLTDWTTRSVSRLAEAQRVLEANKAPMAARNELRGRLDAYRAKAYRSGRLEDTTLSALYQRAYDALYTAPTDLAAAADIVHRYQQALTGPSHREVPR